MKRTLQQNNSLHLFLRRLSDALNAAGLDQRKVLKPGIQIPWTEEAVKAQLWVPIQAALFFKDHTSDLDKHMEIDQVHETLMRHLGQTFGLEYIPFPSDEDRITNYQTKV